MSVAMVVVLLLFLTAFCKVLGGALTNPAADAMLWATGQGSAREHTARAVAQAAGGIVGAALGRALVPVGWQP